MLKTPLCERLGIRLPVWNAGMGGGNAGPELAAAVSNAGGLGVLGMGGLPAPYIRELVRRTRLLTRAPFGVNLLLPLLQEGQIEVCLDEQVPVLILFWGDPEPFVDEVHRRGAFLVQQIGSVDEARAAAAAGVDAVMAQGVEAGGHVRGTLPLAALLPAVADAVAPLPVVAAGGIGDGRGVAAALCLGAQAASLGTRFLCSDEATATAAYKRRVVESAAEDTVYTELFDLEWPSAPHRVLRNRAVDEWERAGRPPSGRRPGEGSVIGRMTIAGATIDAVRYSIFNPLLGFEGDMEYAPLYAGQSCGVVNDILPAARIVEAVTREAERALRGPLAG